MNTKAIPTVLLIITFAMLWIPFGQHSFLVPHWMKLGTFMAPFLLFAVFAFYTEQAVEQMVEPRTISLLLLVLYIVHQFEEHWIDITGTSYAFVPYVNTMATDLLPQTTHDIGPILSETGAFVINTSLVWLVASLAILRGGNHAFPTLCMVAIVVVNAFSHLAAWGLRGEYNPGVLTALVLFLPVGVAAYVRLHRKRWATGRTIAASVLWGVLAHVIMIAGMVASGSLKIIPEAAYFGILVFWSVLPVFLFHPDKYVSQ